LVDWILCSLVSYSAVFNCSSSFFCCLIFLNITCVGLRAIVLEAWWDRDRSYDLLSKFWWVGWEVIDPRVTLKSIFWYFSLYQTNSWCELVTNRMHLAELISNDVEMRQMKRGFGIDIFFVKYSWVAYCLLLLLDRNCFEFCDQSNSIHSFESI